MKKMAKKKEKENEQEKEVKIEEKLPYTLIRMREEIKGE